jgi:hypothetical protein
MRLAGDEALATCAWQKDRAEEQTQLSISNDGPGPETPWKDFVRRIQDRRASLALISPNDFAFQKEAVHIPHVRSDSDSSGSAYTPESVSSDDLGTMCQIQPRVTPSDARPGQVNAASARMASPTGELSDLPIVASRITSSQTKHQEPASLSILSTDGVPAIVVSNFDDHRPNVHPCGVSSCAPAPEMLGGSYSEPTTKLNTKKEEVRSWADEVDGQASVPLSETSEIAHQVPTPSILDKDGNLVPEVATHKILLVSTSTGRDFHFLENQGTLDFIRTRVLSRTDLEIHMLANPELYTLDMASSL